MNFWAYSTYLSLTDGKDIDLEIMTHKNRRQKETSESPQAMKKSCMIYFG